MSQAGYHLSSIGLPGFYEFTLGKPVSYVYRMDYQLFHKKDRTEYLQLFKDAGWEYLGEMSAWQYFRKEAVPGALTEIYTDADSKIAKNKRIITYMSIFCLILAVLAVNIPGGILKNESYPWWSYIPLAIVISVITLLLYAIVRLVFRIRQLNRFAR